MKIMINFRIGNNSIQSLVEESTGSDVVAKEKMVAKGDLYGERSHKIRHDTL